MDIFNTDLNNLLETPPNSAGNSPSDVANSNIGTSPTTDSPENSANNQQVSGNPGSTVLSNNNVESPTLTPPTQYQTNVFNPNNPLPKGQGGSYDAENDKPYVFDIPVPDSPGTRNIFNYNYDNRYIKGYGNQMEKLAQGITGKMPVYNTDEVDDQVLRTQTVVDYDTETFKYWLENNDPFFHYEDPLYNMFDVQIDAEHSPLFRMIKNNKGITKPQVVSFLEDYYIDDMKQRVPIYYEFIDMLLRIFDAEFQDKVNKRNKPYYINNITGLDRVHIGKIVKYKEDKIVIELQEDVSMIAQYISELYNQLCYSYKNQRFMIPENLLRFNMKIKVSDFRNFKNSPKAYTLYSLYDCNFDFFGSKNTGDDISAGGFNLQTPGAAVLKVDVYYKSVGREFLSPIVNKRPLLLNTKNYLNYSGSYDKSEAYTFNNKYKKTDGTFDTDSVFDKTKTGVNQDVFNNVVTKRKSAFDKLIDEVKRDFNPLELINPIVGLNLSEDALKALGGNFQQIGGKLTLGARKLIEKSSTKVKLQLGNSLHEMGLAGNEFGDHLSGPNNGEPHPFVKTRSGASGGQISEDVPYIVPDPGSLGQIGKKGAKSGNEIGKEGNQIGGTRPNGMTPPLDLTIEPGYINPPPPGSLGDLTIEPGYQNPPASGVLGDLTIEPGYQNPPASGVLGDLTIEPGYQNPPASGVLGDLTIELGYQNPPASGVLGDLVLNNPPYVVPPQGSLGDFNLPNPPYTVPKEGELGDLITTQINYTVPKEGELGDSNLPNPPYVVPKEGELGDMGTKCD